MAIHEAKRSVLIEESNHCSTLVTHVAREAQLDLRCCYITDFMGNSLSCKEGCMNADKALSGNMDILILNAPLLVRTIKLQ